LLENAGQMKKPRTVKLSGLGFATRSMSGSMSEGKIILR